MIDHNVTKLHSAFTVPLYVCVMHSTMTATLSSPLWRNVPLLLKRYRYPLWIFRGKYFGLKLENCIHISAWLKVIPLFHTLSFFIKSFESTRHLCLSVVFLSNQTDGEHIANTGAYTHIRHVYDIFVGQFEWPSDMMWHVNKSRTALRASHVTGRCRGLVKPWVSAGWPVHYIVWFTACHAFHRRW